MAAGAPLWDDPRQSGGPSGARPLARALGGESGDLAGPASHGDDRLSGSQCPLRRRHSARRPPGRPGRGSVSSGAEPARSRRSFLHDQQPALQAAAAPDGPGAHPAARAGGQSGHVSRTAPQRARAAAAAGGGATAAPRGLGRHLRGHPGPPRPGHAGHHDCPAARPQPADRLCVSAADHAAAAPQPAAVRPGVAAVHGVSDPPLAGGMHG